MRTDTELLDWLQKVKDAKFDALNGNIAIARVSLFTVESQKVEGNTVREAINKAMDKDYIRTDPR